jgi:dolichol kinase
MATSVAGTPATPIKSLSGSLVGFSVFAIVMLALGAINPKTHTAAMWIMGFVALSILIKLSKNGWQPGTLAANTGGNTAPLS